MYAGVRRCRAPQSSPIALHKSIRQRKKINIYTTTTQREAVRYASYGYSRHALLRGIRVFVACTTLYVVCGSSSRQKQKRHRRRVGGLAHERA